MTEILIIAEAGVNHNGDFRIACELVDAACDAGADIIKFQTFNPRALATIATPQASYQTKNIGLDGNQVEMLSRYQLSVNEFREIHAYAVSKGIEFLSTPFDLESLEFLCQLSPRRWKVPSGEITNLPFLESIAHTGLPVILSTGMSGLSEIEQALSVLTRNGCPRELVTLLHCTSEYPAPYENVNLLAMVTMANAFNLRVGYSDHTDGIEVSIASVALGAVVIEKHITLDRSMHGPDHKASIEPDIFKAMVSSIRKTAVSLGSPVKAPTANELDSQLLARKSIVASKPFKCGDVFGPHNLTAKRPGTGLSPMLINDLYGLQSHSDFAPDEQITLGNS